MSEPVISSDYLNTVLRLALGDPAAEAGKWALERLKGGLEYASTIYRLSGTALVAGAERHWSLILKVLQPQADCNDPDSYSYWKRDPLAYQSGLLYALPGKVTAPRCFDVRDNPDGSVWICMEEVEDKEQRPWTIERYAQVARQLGEFNGAYLAGRPLPTEAWITHNWLRSYLEHAAPMVDFIRQNPDHPIVQLALPGISKALTLAVWDEHARMLQALDRMPQTFCHQDAFERNLFYRSEEVVAIDWSFAGIAPLGIELVSLVGVAFGLAKFPSSQAKELDQACFQSYLEGVRQAGWQPDVRQVRLAYCLTLLLRYVLGATVGEMLPGLLDQATRTHWVEGMQQSEETAGESDPGIVSYYMSVAMEGFKLMGLGTVLRMITRTLSLALRLRSKPGSQTETNS